MSVRKRKWKTSKGIECEAWIVDYADQQGQRRLKTFATKKEADAWRVDALHEVKQGTHTPASVSKTAEAEGLELSTIKQRRVHLRVHIKPFIGGEKLSTLTMPRISQFDADLRDNGRSLAMRRKVLTSVKSMLTFAQSKGWIAQNVARGIKVKSDERNAP